MHQPPVPHVASTDPQIAELIEDEARRQFEKLRMIAFGLLKKAIPASSMLWSAGS